MHNHDGVITHLDPDILECEVKWTLGSITMNRASEGDGIPAFRFFISSPKKGNAKECSSYHTIALISHASKVMLKILQDELHHYMN